VPSAGDSTEKKRESLQQWRESRTAVWAKGQVLFKAGGWSTNVEPLSLLETADLDERELRQLRELMNRKRRLS